MAELDSSTIYGSLTVTNGVLISGGGLTVDTWNISGATLTAGTIDSTVRTRHIQGKSATADTADTLYLNYSATAKGVIIGDSGTDHPLTVYGNITISGSGTLQYNQSSPSGTNILGYNGYLYATRVYNAVYNDYADYWGKLPNGEKAIVGKVYKGMVHKMITMTTKRNDMSTLGICSDTYGFAVGKGVGDVPLSVSGFVLAFVDQEYPIGTKLINDENGNLTQAIGKEKEDAIAKFVDIEPNSNRSWVKVLL